MSKKERARVVAGLPSEPTGAGVSPPEGERHFNAKAVALDTLRKFFGRGPRGVYVAAELPVYYPGEDLFAPDLLAVVDAKTHEREKWVKSEEGRGLSFVMEVYVGGDWKKDSVRNVALYARLGIPEYFIYDRSRQRLWGYHLLREKDSTYKPILPQLRRFHSDQLDLDLTIEDEKLRFYYRDAALPESAELIAKLERVAESLQQRADAAAERAETEAAKARDQKKKAKEAEKRADQQARRAVKAEARVKVLEKQLRKLRPQ